jgi:diguanylate cyclase (GGDEF)-like protein
MATAALDSLLTRASRLRRCVLLVAAIGGYALFAWLVTQAGLMRAADEVREVVAAFAAAGLALLPFALAADFDARADHTRLRGLVAGWLVASIVATALLADTALRLLLLASSLLALICAALHVQRQQLRWVAIGAWACYALGALALLMLGVIDGARETALNTLGYTVAVTGAWLVAREVADLRDTLSGRTRALETALAKVRDLAMRDDLTGLFNRRYLLEVLQRQKALADRDALRFAVCYVDLDHFKRVNDRFGHLQGDDVLKAFAEVARRVVREEDFVARIGGEEFVLVLINATVADAERVADRLRRQTQLMLIHPDAPDFAVTASVGIAAYRKREPIEQLLARADAAMYAAKGQGRNRVVVAPGSETDGMHAAAGR